MQDPKTATARKTLAVALLSVVGGLIGMWAGRGVAVSRCQCRLRRPGLGLRCWLDQSRCC